MWRQIGLADSLLLLLFRLPVITIRLVTIIWLTPKHLLIYMMICIVIGCFTECSQPIRGLSFDWWDVRSFVWRRRRQTDLTRTRNDAVLASRKLLLTLMWPHLKIEKYTPLNRCKLYIVNSEYNLRNRND